MPSQNIHVVQDVGTLEEAYEQLAKLQKTLRYLLDGNLDFENIRAKGIIAETIDVDELSAISADLGTITAGIIRGIQIYGSYIATAEGTYPRAEMSNTQNHFRASTDANRYINISSFELSTGTPYFTFRENSNMTQLFMDGTLFTISSSGDISIQTLEDIFLIANRISFMLLGGMAEFPSWSSIYSIGAGQTLQSALNTKANAFSGFSGSFDTGDGRVATFSNGICVSVV